MPSTPGLALRLSRPTATAKITSAVPSLIRLSACRVVSSLRGSRLASPVTAAASVGARTAPSTQAAAGFTPNACAANDTVTMVSTTSTTASSPITGRLARISRRLMVRLSRYRIAGRKISSTRSGSRVTSDSGGVSPSSTPNAMSRTGGATRYRPPRVVPTRTVTPSTTIRTSASTRTPLGPMADGGRAGGSI